MRDSSKLPLLKLPKQTGTPEGRARNAICEYLTMLKNQGLLDFWVVRSTGLYDPKTNRFRALHKYERTGIPDISGFFYGSGIRLDIEVKAPHPKKSPHQMCSEEQKEFLTNATKAGGVAFAAATVADVQRYLEHPIRWTKGRLEGMKNGSGN